MEASICCVIYGNYKYDNEDCEYEKALKELNEYLIDLKKRDKLSAEYDGKEVEIELPLPSWKVGNIFEEEVYPYWEGVELPCIIKDVNEEDFDPKKLRLSKKPDAIRRFGSCW